MSDSLSPRVEASDEKKMSLDEAITVLCESHLTNIMEDEHWEIWPMAHRQFPRYAVAWKVLRDRLVAYRTNTRAETRGEAK